MRTLFLGGPGNISESTISRLLAAGREVTVLKRTAGGLFGLDGRIEVVLGDRDDENCLTRTITQSRPDLIVDATCFNPAQAEVVIRVLSRLPCPRLVFISTADVYGYPLSRLPMREDDPWHPPRGEYALNKAIIERRYRDALTELGIGLTIIRPGYSLGKTFALSAFSVDGGARLAARIRAGLPVYSPGDGTTLIDAGAAFNTGAMIARICLDEDANGEAFTCGHDRAVTYDDYLGAFAEALGTKASIVHIPTDFMMSLGAAEVASSLLPELSRFHLYFSVDKFKAWYPDFCWEWSLTDAVTDFVTYQDSIGGLDHALEPGFEDRVVTAWVEAQDELKSRILAGIKHSTSP